jgi:quercetin dioxygenase-like cupin family protein
MKGSKPKVAILSAAIVAMALYFTVRVRATPAVGFSASTVAKGTFGDISVFNKSVSPASDASQPASVWLSLQKTNGNSDLYVQNNTWQVGGATGWHTHPGHSLIIVTEGTVTEYEGGDASCTPHVYTAGMTLVDPGGDHVHIIRNEGSVVARTVAVQMIPAGAVRRIDVEDPGNCHF